MSNAIIMAPQRFAVLSASNQAAGFAASNLDNDYAGVLWGSTSATTADVKVDFGANVPIDTLMLFGVTGALAATTVTVLLATEAQGSGFGAGAFWSAGAATLLSGDLPTSGKGACLFILPTTGSPPAAARYALVQFSSPSATALRAARLVMGKRIQLARNFAFNGAFGVRDFSDVDFSPRAVLLRRRGPKLRTLSVVFSNIYRDEVESAVQPLIELAGNSEPIALVTDPDAHAKRQSRMYFGMLSGDLATIWRNAAASEWRANLVSLF